MAQAHPFRPKHRFQLSMLVMLLVGLVSAASPQSFRAAHLHHRSPTSSSRTSRHLNRSRGNGSSRTSADAEVEPELAASSDTTALPARSQQHAALVSATRTYFPLKVYISCIAPDNLTLALSAPPLPHLGRAPPVA
jgi:hypothetical protein